MLFDLTGVHIQFEDLKHVAGGTLIHLDSWTTKRRLMENKYKLGTTKIIIEDDLTCREQEVQWRIKEVGKARKKGSNARAFYMEWQISNMEFWWSEKEGLVTEKLIDKWQDERFFRGRRGNYQWSLMEFGRWKKN